MNSFSFGIIKTVHGLQLKSFVTQLLYTNYVFFCSKDSLKVNKFVDSFSFAEVEFFNDEIKSKHSLTSMLASMVKPQAQIRAKPSETSSPTQSPMDISSPHSHIGPNLPRFTSNTCRR